MKTAQRLSFLLTASCILLTGVAPAFGQSDFANPYPPEQGLRTPWYATNGSIVSAEHSRPTPGTRPIYDPVNPSTPRPPSGTVSLARLENPPPAKAVKEMDKAAKAAAEGEHERAIEHYEKAIEIHPEYVEAYNNLGVQYLKAGRDELALSVLERAVLLDPSSAEPHLNLAVALHGAGHLDAAAMQADRAVEIAPQSAAANLGLGLVLTAQGRRLEEALRRLQFAALELPGASLAAADALLQLDRPKEAQAALRAFLSRAPEAIK